MNFLTKFDGILKNVQKCHKVNAENSCHDKTMGSVDVVASIRTSLPPPTLLWSLLASLVVWHICYMVHQPAGTWLRW